MNVPTTTISKEGNISTKVFGIIQYDRQKCFPEKGEWEGQGQNQVYIKRCESRKSTFTKEGYKVLEIGSLYQHIPSCTPNQGEKEKEEKPTEVNINKEDDFWNQGSNAKKEDDNFWNESTNKPVAQKSSAKVDDFWNSNDNEAPNDNKSANISQSANNYKTVTIGDQVWMAENLKVKNFKNGDSISLKFHPTDSTYYHEVIIDPRGICPLGWRLPMQKDWELLFTQFGTLTKKPYFKEETRVSWGQRLSFDREIMEYEYSIDSRDLSSLISLNIHSTDANLHAYYWCDDYYITQYKTPANEIGDKIPQVAELILQIGTSGYLDYKKARIRTNNEGCIRCVKE